MPDESFSISLYVDAIMINIGNDLGNIVRLKQILQHCFRTKYLGQFDFWVNNNFISI